MTQLQEHQTKQVGGSGGGGSIGGGGSGGGGVTIKAKTRRRANSVAFACRTDYGLPDDSDDDLPKNPLLLVTEPERRRSAIDSTEGAKERDRAKIFTLS